MANLTGPAFTMPTRSFPVNQAGAGFGIGGELVVSELTGKYSHLVKQQKVFFTSAIITAPVIFSTAAQLGPMIWNKGGSAVDAHILAVCVGAPTTATSVQGAFGLSSNQQPAAPTTATAITAWNAYSGGVGTQMGAVNSTATVVIVPTPIFLPLTWANSAAVTVASVGGSGFVDVGGLMIIPPGNVGYVTVSATLTSGVYTLGLVWAELPA